MSMYNLLSYENDMFLELYHDSGFMICAKGLGIDRILYNFIKLYCDPHSLVLVINCTPLEAEFFIENLSLDGIQPLPTIITADIGQKERESLYKKGGVLFVTSRILVMDFLLERVPYSLIAGLLVNRAHKTLESSQESFIIRMLRERNADAFVKAFSDSPTSVTTGFSQVNHVMSQLHVHKLMLWPRFHATIANCLNNLTTEVEEIAVRMTPAMIGCQKALLDLINGCLKELTRLNPSLDVEELTVEYALTKSFEKLVRLYLDPVWHQLSAQSRQEVSNITTLRRLVTQLTAADPVAFYLTVVALRKSEYSSGLSDASSKQRNGASWMLMDEAEKLFLCAKDRVFKTDSKATAKESDKKLCIEIPPKWQAVKQVLDEIKNIQQKNDKDLAQFHSGRTLILVEEERTGDLLREFIEMGQESVVNTLAKRYDDARVTTSSTKNKTSRSKKIRPSNKSESSTPDLLNDKDDEPSGNIIDQEELPQPLTMADVSLSEFPNCHAISDPVTVIVPLRRVQLADRPQSQLSVLLDRARPVFVIVYDPDMECVRQIEVYKAAHSEQPLRAYFLMYDGSVEEQKYLTTLRKEKEAFEYLIKERSNLVITAENLCPPSMLEQHDTTELSSRRAGGQISPCHRPPTVFVDMREFRSELPALLHRKGIVIKPITLRVSDYILTPDISVERKSVSDLIGSLNSGRLYNQCLSMSRHYKTPVLLIEFTTATGASSSSASRLSAHRPCGFSLYAGNQAVSNQLSANDLLSKITLLTLHFPMLRLLWTVSPYATAELFGEIKLGLVEPTLETLPEVERSGSSVEESVVENATAIDMLMKLPGITWANYKSVLKRVNSLADLANTSLEGMEEMLQNREYATQLYQFFNRNHSDTIKNLPVEQITATKRRPNFKLAEKAKPSKSSKLK